MRLCERPGMQHLLLGGKCFFDGGAKPRFWVLRTAAPSPRAARGFPSGRARSYPRSKIDGPLSRGLEPMRPAIAGVITTVPVGLGSFPGLGWPRPNRARMFSPARAAFFLTCTVTPLSTLTGSIYKTS